MMKICINTSEKVQIFKTIVACIQQFTNELNIIVSDEKVYIQGMDQSHISMYEVTLTRDWFETYDVDHDNTYGIDCNYLHKILSVNISDCSCMELEFHENTIVTILRKSKKTGGSKTFKLTLIDLDCATMGIQEIEHHVKITLPSKLFKVNIDELSNFGDSTTIKCDEDSILFNSKSDMIDTEFKLEMSDVSTYECIKDVKMTFNLKFIKLVNVLSKIAPNVSIELNDEMPIKLTYDLDDDNDMSDINTFRFFMAPKMDDDYEE